MRRNRTRARIIAVVSAVTLAAGVSIATQATASAQPPGHWVTKTPGYNPGQVNPKTTVLAGSTAPDALRFDVATGCSTGPQSGTLHLRAYIERRWPRGEDWGVYNCRSTSSGGWSEHAEGRAYDHGLDKANADDRAAAENLIANLTKADSNGNRNAIARRFGIEQIIWDCKIWTSNNPTFRDFSGGSNCAGWSKTDAHRDHVHIGQSWRGARENTSAYTGYLVFIEDVS